ncbi:adenylate/guanylate cyclase domain-containing protein [Brevibacterium sp. K11IcPPYGO002]|uniref:adenylate/guanylate cyclase domain-containing protein n=1 Tax=Brevibacterium sp. K11IcPPYGO002 TaxID=3058837 RepID=UPI003D815EC0
MYPTIAKSVGDIFAAAWNISNGTVVPKTEDVVMKNGGRLVDATYLYADLAGSTKLAHTLKKEASATIIRAYINSASRILRHCGGNIRSFDGDRVMAIFMGSDKNVKAVRAALGINWAVYRVIQPAIEAKWTDVSQSYTINHGVGIDTGEALIVRGGVRDNNDLISIGDAPNDAARLSEHRKWNTNITKPVYEDLDESIRLLADGRNFWTSSNGIAALGNYTTLYHSDASWEI